MKNKIFIFFLLLILLGSCVSGLSIELHEEYDKGETLITKVSGNFLENIKKENIFFYRRHMATSVAEYDVLKIQDQFFIYAKLDESKVADNYSIQIKNVKYMNGSQVSEEPIIGNFSISEDVSDFWVSPGAKTVEQDYFLTVQNLQPEPITIFINQEEASSSSGGGWFSNLLGGGNESNESNETAQADFSIEVLSGEIKDIEFTIGTSTSLKEIKLSSENTEYFVPIYEVPGEWIEENNTLINETINESEDNGILEEDIIEEDLNEEIIIINENGEEEIITREEAKLFTCQELNGISCLSNETCEGSETYASDSLCCLGECIVEEKSSSGKVIGWGLLIVAVLVLGWIFLKKKNKTGSKVNLLNVAGGKK